MAEPEYPEHERLRAIKDQSQAIGEFLDWMSTQGVVRARWGCHHGYVTTAEVQDEPPECRLCTQTDKLWPDTTRIPDLLASYFGIDQVKLEDEKQAMLETLRAS